MELEKVKKHLQNYLDSVLLPKVNKERTEKEKESIELNVHSILKGSYQPPIYHVFIDVEPHHTLRADLKKCETDIADFFKMFSINSKIKVQIGRAHV